MKKLFFIVLLICFVARFTYAETVDRIVAVVGNDVITLYDLDRAMAPYVDEIKKSPNKDDKFKTVKSEILDHLVDDHLLRQAIENSKVKVSEDEVARAIKNVLSQNHITIDMLKSELAGKGISFESYKEELKLNIQKIKFVNQEIGSRVRISDQDMHDYYQKHMSEFGAHQSVHIAQIVLPFEQGMTEAKAKDLKKKAEEIVAQARTGTPFASLAKQYSKGPNAETGGDLGVVDPSNLMPEIATFVKGMNVGDISKPIISPAGIHIIKLIDRAKATESDFEKLKDKIYNTMYDERIMEELNQYLSEMRKKTFVEIRE